MAQLLLDQIDGFQASLPDSTPSRRCKALEVDQFSPTSVVRDIDGSSVYAFIEEVEMREPPKERFEILRRLHIPGLDKRSDELVEFSKLAMEKKPTDEITARLIEIGIQAAITAKDKVELEEQRALLTDEERDICEALEWMTDAELRQLGKSIPEHRELITALLFHQDECRRFIDEAREIGKRLKGME